MNAKILDGRSLAGRILKAAASEARRVKARRGRAPRLAIVCAPDSAAQSYMKSKLSACAQAGVELVVHRLSPGTRTKTL